MCRRGRPGGPHVRKADCWEGFWQVATLRGECGSSSRAGIDVPAAAHPGFRVRRGSRDRRVPRRSGRHPRLPVAGTRGGPRVPARVRRHRPLAHQGRARRRGGLPGDGQAAARPRPRPCPRHRPQPHGGARQHGAEPAAVVGPAGRPRVARTPTGSTSTGRRRTTGCCCRSSARPVESCLGDLRVEAGGGPDGEPALRYFDHVLPLRPGTAGLPMPGLLESQHYRLGLVARRLDRAQLAAVLQRHLADRSPGRGAGRVRRDPRGHRPAGGRGAGGRPPDRSSGRAGRPARLPGQARVRDRRRLGGGREDPRGGRDAAGRLGLRGHDRLRRAQADRRALR